MYVLVRGTCECVWVGREGGREWADIKIFQSNVMQEIPNHGQQTVLNGFKFLVRFLFNCEAGRVGNVTFKGSRDQTRFFHKQELFRHVCHLLCAIKWAFGWNRSGQSISLLHDLNP